MDYSSFPRTFRYNLYRLVVTSCLVSKTIERCDLLCQVLVSSVIPKINGFGLRLSAFQEIKVLKIEYSLTFFGMVVWIRIPVDASKMSHILPLSEYKRNVIGES